MSDNAWPTFTVELGTTPGLVPAAWEDITDRMLEPSVLVDYGRGSELDQDETGTASMVVDNLDGWKQYGINPNTAVRIKATLGAVEYPVLYHLVESAPVTWPFRGKDAVIPVATADGMTLLAREDRDEVTRPQERTGARIAALLDLAGWPAALRDLDEGVVLVDAIEDVSLNVLNGIRDAVEAEQGQMFVGPDGVFSFRDRHARLDQSYTVNFGGEGDTIRDHLGDPLLDHAGNEIGDGTIGVTYQNLVPKYDDSTLWTVGRAEMADGRVYEYIDDAAADLYGRRTYPVRDVGVASVEVKALAAWIVVRYSEPERRFESLELQAADTESLQAAMVLRPGQLVRIQSDAIGGGDPVDELSHVEKISHDIGTSLWHTTLHLSPYYGAGPWLILDDPERGLMDGTRKVAP